MFLRILKIFSHPHTDSVVIKSLFNYFFKKQFKKTNNHKRTPPVQLMYFFLSIFGHLFSTLFSNGTYFAISYGRASAFASLRTICSQGRYYRLLSFIYIKVGDDDAPSHTIFCFDFESKPGFMICLVFQAFPLWLTSNATGIILFYFVDR